MGQFQITATHKRTTDMAQKVKEPNPENLSSIPLAPHSRREPTSTNCPLTSVGTAWLGHVSGYTHSHTKCPHVKSKPTCKWSPASVFLSNDMCGNTWYVFRPGNSWVKPQDNRILFGVQHSITQTYNDERLGKWEAMSSRLNLSFHPKEVYWP